MTDRQKLVYDLSMHCALVDFRNGFPSTGNPAASFLDSFIGYINLYRGMDPSKLDAVLDALKKV